MIEMDEFAKGVSDISLKGSEDDVWEQVTREHKNRALGTTKNDWPTNDSSNAWGWKRLEIAYGLDVPGIDGSDKVLSSPWDGEGLDTKRVTSVIGSFKTKSEDEEEKELVAHNVEGLNDDDCDDGDDSDFDDDFLSDDSDESPKSHEARKNHRMLRTFFEVFDDLREDDIKEPGRRWHCPACQGGPFSIQWYRGMQRLIAHAKTKTSVRPFLHREFLHLLEEELHRKGFSVVASGESCGHGEGLKQEARDFSIVWPPMVIIMNSRPDKEENEKRVGMGNEELLDHFSSYHPVKAQNSYDPVGNVDMSVLVFESSAAGYLDAERLHNHFIKQEMGRDAWNNPHRKLFCTGGKHQLYGFLAVKEDVDTFNQLCQGKSEMMFEMKSYMEMVASQMKSRSEDNQKVELEESI